MSRTPMLTTAETCDLLGVKPHALLRLREDEGLPYYRLSSKRVRYPRDEVLEWMEERKRGGK